MRIVAWNCQMGFAAKLDAFFSLDSDLAVISECSRESALSMISFGYQVFWFGSNPRKGLAVLAKDGGSIEAITDPEQKWIVPVRVTWGDTIFILIAVWACREGHAKSDRYIGLLHRALTSHPEWFLNHPVVLAGDWNSNKIWDLERKTGNHSSVVAMLEQKGIVSSYHSYFDEAQGQETRPTCYLYRHQTRPFHIDYVFVPGIWTKGLKSVEVGAFDSWSGYSDHCPVAVEFA
jgi:exonuclease III